MNVGDARVRGAALVALLAALVSPMPAQATWSIVAVDPETGEVGAAGASCILGSEVIAIVVPGRGAAVAQAMTNPDARVKLQASIAAGESAEEALGEVTTRWFDSFFGAPTLNLRQYGAVTLSDPDAPANFTGAWTASTGAAATAHGVSVQGNSLVSAEVVSDALSAFVSERDGCRPDLADRLVAALVAGSAAGGDQRCARELSALSAFLHVAGADGVGEVRLVRNRPGQPPWSLWQEIQNALRPAPGTPAENPVRLLRAAYREQRAAEGKNACLSGSSLP